MEEDTGAGQPASRASTSATAQYEVDVLRVQGLREPLRDQPGGRRGREAALLRQPLREVRRGPPREGRSRTSRTSSPSARRCCSTPYVPAARARRRTRRAIGIPRALLFHELYPVLAGVLQASSAARSCSRTRPTSAIIHEGAERSVAETCFPMKVALGHVLNLLDKEIDYIFLPSVINLPQAGRAHDRQLRLPVRAEPRLHHAGPRWTSRPPG